MQSDPIEKKPFFHAFPAREALSFGMLGLAGGHDRASGTLPLGLKKRLEIARALALEPRLLLLDEPSGGLRHEESQQLLELIRGLNRDGISVILISHRMDDIFYVCDRVMALFQ